MKSEHVHVMFGSVIPQSSLEFSLKTSLLSILLAFLVIASDSFTKYKASALYWSPFFKTSRVS